MRHRRSWILSAAVVASLGCAGVIAQTKPSAEDVRAQAIVGYLAQLERAEQQLADGEHDAALMTLGDAIKAAPPVSYLRQMPVRKRAATAHYLLARAHGAAGRLDAAFAALGLAAERRFTDRGRVEKELKRALGADPRWAKALGAFAKPDAVLAGKTVKTRELGYQLIMGRRLNFPKLGERAPEIERAWVAGGEGSFELSSYRGKKPVVLIFGSYT